jgi:hypothetical protein
MNTNQTNVSTVRISDEQAARNLARTLKQQRDKTARVIAETHKSTVDKHAITVKRYGASSIAAQLSAKGLYL